ncbi:hypothetical protein [Croceicoccus pelagius]|uniref:Uncharacterized protein n=1 Tax=Croceicoccus pelagius TaxID=1703341 RepID=A0A916YEQ7_9SPHN|nr:hypothetical protein [Croceicoccus pelagius]GGD41739.1 hypothetical protein GCM10010989_14690 [Croceicoccus pelagius]
MAERPVIGGGRQSVDGGQPALHRRNDKRKFEHTGGDPRLHTHPAEPHDVAKKRMTRNKLA